MSDVKSYGVSLNDGRNFSVRASRTGLKACPYEVGARATHVGTELPHRRRPDGRPSGRVRLWRKLCPAPWT